jgi:hypothetical protein
MKLARAVRYGHHRAAVSCRLQPVPLLAHVVRQGGILRYWQPDDTTGKTTRQPYWVPEWWIVSTSPLSPYYEAGRMAGFEILLKSPYWETMSFATLDGCYRWLRQRGISPHEGWSPARHDERWWNLGSGGWKCC